jgi:hypothetical protein
VEGGARARSPARRIRDAAVNRPAPVAAPDVLLRAAEAAGRDTAASLLALEEHAGLRFLGTAPLTGESARRRDAVVATVAAMHADLARHRDVVARARAARGPHPRPSTADTAAVLGLLRGPSVLVQEAVPAPRRGPVDGPVVARRLTPATLLARVRAAYAAVWTEAARAVAVWEAVATALDPLDAALDEALTTLGHDTTRRAALEDAREAVTAVRREVLTDLLVHDPRRPVDPAVLAALADLVRALRDDPAGARPARDDRPARRRRLAEALDALEAEEAAAHAVAVRASRGEHHAPPPARADALRALPDGIEAELDVAEAEVAAATAAVRAYRRALHDLDGSGDEVVAGARPSGGTDPGHRRVDRAQPGPRV